jgi:dTDP-4-amino-4,6-dideoxygalactose transaminase
MAQLAILGGPPLRSRPYPSWPIWDETEREALVATLESGAWWSGDGDRAQRFADDFAAFQGARHGLPMTNGTHTLEAALVALGVGPGDEVIVPAITFVASATAVLATGAEPVIVDVDADTLCIDAVAAEAAITDRTRAIIAVHCGGCVADLDALLALCDRRGLRLVEDCAHAHGSSWRGRGVGSWGAFGSFSMQGGKLLTAGEGGALLTNDPELEDLAWQYHNCGRERGRWFYHHRTPGSNLRMTEWQGAVLSAQLARFADQHAIRNANAVVLNEALAEIPGIRPQPRDERMDANGNYCFIFHYDAAAFAGLPLRDFEAALDAEGVPMGVSYPSLGDLELFAGDGRPEVPVAVNAAATTVWLQHRMLLARRESVLDVARAVEKVQAGAAELAARSATVEG